MRSCSQDLLDGLIGDDQKRCQLQEFIASPDVFASNKFGIESLCEALSLPYEKGDKQVNLMSKHLGNNIITIVDYGAGKGRLLEGLSEDYKYLLARLDYYAFDPSDKDAEICKRNMYDNKIPLTNYTNHMDDLLEILPNNGTDAVLLVNVLHEIEPKYWSEVFTNIQKLLKPNGILILVESEILSQGEKAYDNGFLVMTEEALKTLLSTTEIQVKREKIALGSIVSYTIGKEHLCGVNDSSVATSIQNIAKNSLEHIKEIKSLKIDPAKDETVLWKEGLCLAFWTHQYANAQLNNSFIQNQSTLQSE